MKSSEQRYIASAAIVALRVTCLVVVVGWVLLVSEDATLPFLAIAALATPVAAWQVREGLANGGVREESDGISNRRFGGHQRWTWAEIDRFSNVGSRVFIVLQDGRTSMLTGIAQGHKNISRDGETRDIVGLLNERLATWRSSQAAGKAKAVGSGGLS